MEISNNVEISKANYTTKTEKSEKAIKVPPKIDLEVEAKSFDEGIENAGANEEENVITKNNIAEFTSRLNKAISFASTQVRFEYGDDIDGLYVNVIDTNTDSVIRRYPSEEAAKLSAYTKEIVGAMLDKKI